MAASTMASTQALSLQSFHSLHEGLLGIKHTTEDTELYPNHAFARGGIGAFLATGARGGVSYLPKPKRHGGPLHGTGRSASARTYAGGATSGSSRATGGGGEAPTTPGRSGSRSPLHLHSGASAQQAGSGGGLGSTVGTTTSPQSPVAAEIEGAAVKEWRRGVPHVNNFTTAARSSRPHDVPPASRWVGISFYENDPQQVKRHMDVMAWVDQVHTHSKLLEREKERHRHAAWAEEQREMFRRQRVEQAARYLRAGLPPTPSYAWAEASRPATGATGMSLPLSTSTFTAADWRSSFGARTSDNGLGQSMSMAGASSTRRPHTAMPAAIPLPKHSFHRVQDRIYSEQADAPMSSAETLRQAAQETEARRQAAAVADQMRELDDFELHLRALGRQQLAQQQAMHQQYAERSGASHRSPSSRATGAVH